MRCVSPVPIRSGRYVTNKGAAGAKYREFGGAEGTVPFERDQALNLANPEKSPQYVQIAYFAVGEPEIAPRERPLLAQRGHWPGLSETAQFA